MDAPDQVLESTCIHGMIISAWFGVRMEQEDRANFGKPFDILGGARGGV